MEQNELTIRLRIQRYKMIWDEKWKTEKRMSNTHKTWTMWNTSECIGRTWTNYKVSTLFYYYYYLRFYSFHEYRHHHSQTCTMPISAAKVYDLQSVLVLFSTIQFRIGACNMMKWMNGWKNEKNEPCGRIGCSSNVLCGKKMVDKIRK